MLRRVRVEDQALPEGRLMMRRFLAVFGAAAIILAAVVPTAVTAKQPTKFQRIDVSKIDAKLIPQILQANRLEKVILELGGKPVAVRQAEAGRRLSNAQKAAIRAQLKAAQDALRRDIARTGGRILGQYQDAYDGIKVQVRANRIARLASLPGVVAVHGVQTYTIDNTVGVPYIGAPAAWNDLGLAGAGVKVGIIDTGIDYYHANFGGSGNPADFAADDGLTIGTAAFPSAKVAGGYDLVGDDYNAAGSGAALIPHPDPDPLDCFGHGSHVAGTAAGQGVLSDGTTYPGPYNASTISGHSWKIGPGVAPQATLYAYRVFGCAGSTDVVVDAINRAVADGMDVINMSLGSPFGSADNPDAVASNNAALAGTTVVASAGNSGPNAMITGSPGTADRVISVAALDALASFAGASIDIGAGITGINANNGPLPVTGNVRVLLLNPTTISLGCAAADYASVLPGEIVVTRRGTCDRVDRAKFGQAVGAGAVVMVNNAAGLPPFEGNIPGVTIPFIGVSSTAGPALISANGTTHTISALAIANPTFQQIATFSSGGPRDYDNAVKPDVTAPGVSVMSTGMGTGVEGAVMSGTSMAAPHTAGVAALVSQAHPSWTPEQIKAAIENTANPSPGTGGILNYNLRIAGSGVVRARRAVDTVGLATTGGGTSSLSYGYDPADGSVSESLPITLWNTSASAITYNLASDSAMVTISLSPVTVPAHGSRTVNAKLKIGNAAMSGLPGAGTVATQSVVTIRGAITATPTVGGSGRYPLRVPFLVSPRGLSNVTAGALSAYSLASGVASAAVPLSNSGIHAGTADVYAWGLSDSNNGLQRNDIRAVGVQTFAGGGDATLVFAVNTYGRWGNASDNEFDIGIDTNHDGTDDYFVVGVDGGAVLAGSFDGRMLSFTFDSHGNLIDAFLVTAPVNGSTVELPTLASDLGLGSGHSAFDYDAAGFSIFGGPFDVASGVGHFDALDPALSQGDFLTLGRGATPTLNVSVDETGFAANPALGWMVVTLDDANGAAQADLVPVGALP
jgi:minor extracellular serine protease Vpr